VIADWVGRTPWVEFVASLPATRSNTSICLKIAGAELTTLPEDARAAIPRRMAELLDAEDVVKDIAAYRYATPGLRIWTGATIERSDLEALTPWLDWAYAEVMRDGI
jgi:phosphoserine aminotransferase